MRSRVSLPAHDDVAVGRHGADLRPTRPERCGENALSAGVDDDRKIDLHTPVHGPRFELGRIVGRQIQADAAVLRLDIEPGSLPPRTGELDLKATVLRPPSEGRRRPGVA